MVPHNRGTLRCGGVPFIVFDNSAVRCGAVSTGQNRIPPQPHRSKLLILDFKGPRKGLTTMFIQCESRPVRYGTHFELSESCGALRCGLLSSDNPLQCGSIRCGFVEDKSLRRGRLRFGKTAPNRTVPYRKRTNETKKKTHREKKALATDRTRTN